MKRFLTAAAILALVAPAAAGAQTLQAGRWTGTVTPPDEPSVDVTYDITVNGDSIGMVLNAGEHGSFTMSNVKLAEGKLTFVFSPGSDRLNCTMAPREDGTWTGECVDEEGLPGQLVMIPPKKDG